MGVEEKELLETLPLSRPIFYFKVKQIFRYVK